jgi:hypothetical protein
MNVSKLIRATLAAAATPGCTGWPLHCNRDDYFDVDTGVSQETIDEILEREGLSSASEIDCETLCGAVWWGEEPTRIDECNADIDTSVQDTAGDATVGSIQCSGVAPDICKGRRPLGFRETAERPRGAGATFAHFAMLEAASVSAFRQLRRQLRDWSAPHDLLDRCADAERDEVGHAILLRRLAHRHGARVPVASIAAHREDRFAVALHNATEGCVSETWSALLAHWIAAVATDETVRSMFARIAEDETRHAQLAWDLHAWLCTGLDETERQLIDDARRRALEALPDVARLQAAALPEILGLGDARAVGATARDFAARLAA